MSVLPAFPSAINSESPRLNLDRVRYQCTISSAASILPAAWFEAEQAYRRFLAIKQRHPGLLLIPSGSTLQIWQAHVLDTCAYRADCHALFGRFIDHFPYLGQTDKADRLEFEQAQRRFEDLYACYFGNVALLRNPECKA